ncbi:Rho GTPase-activating protein 19 [Balamuthia mandrillaris]
MLQRSSSVTNLLRWGSSPSRTIFGCSIDSKYGQAFAYKCLEQMDKHVLVQGIYRVSGRLTDVEELVKKINKGKDVDLGSLEPHVLANLLKQFLRELTEPPLTFFLYESFVGAIQTEEAERKQLLREFLGSVPSNNFRLVAHVVRHLRAIADLSDKNLMTSDNLAIVFGPVLLRPKVSSLETILADVAHVNNIVSTFIDDYHYFFEDRLKTLEAEEETSSNDSSVEKTCNKKERNGDKDGNEGKDESSPDAGRKAYTIGNGPNVSPRAAAIRKLLGDDKEKPQQQQQQQEPELASPKKIKKTRKERVKKLKEINKDWKDKKIDTQPQHPSSPPCRLTRSPTASSPPKTSSLTSGLLSPVAMRRNADASSSSSLDGSDESTSSSSTAGFVLRNKALRELKKKMEHHYIAQRQKTKTWLNMMPTDNSLKEKAFRIKSGDYTHSELDIWLKELANEYGRASSPSSSTSPRQKQPESPKHKQGTSARSPRSLQQQQQHQQALEAASMRSPRAHHYQPQPASQLPNARHKQRSSSMTNSTSKREVMKGPSIPPRPSSPALSSSPPLPRRTPPVAPSVAALANTGEQRAGSAIVAPRRPPRLNPHSPSASSTSQIIASSAPSSPLISKKSPSYDLLAGKNRSRTDPLLSTSASSLPTKKPSSPAGKRALPALPQRAITSTPNLSLQDTHSM